MSWKWPGPTRPSRSPKRCVKSASMLRVRRKHPDLQRAVSSPRRLACARLNGIGQGNIRQPELNALAAIPAIDRKISRGMHGLPAVFDQRTPERLVRRTEGNRVDEGAVAGFESRANVRLSD